MASRWSYSEFFGLFSRFVTKATELKHVDGMLDVVESRRGGPPLAGSSPYEIPIGTTYPFTQSVLLTPGTVAPFEQRLSDAAGAAAHWSGTTFTGLEERIGFIVESMPSVVGVSVDQLESVGTSLELIGNSQDLGDLNAYLADWTGQAKEGFEAYRSSIVRAAAHQSTFTKSIAAYVDIAAGIARGGQVDLFAYVEALEAAADDQLRKRQSDNRGPTPSEVMTVLAAVGGTLGAIPGPQQLLVAGATSVLSLGAIMSAEPQVVSFSAASAEQLGDLFVGGLEGTAGTVDTLLGDLDTQVRALKEQFELVWSDLVPAEPVIDGSTSVADFHRP